MTRLIMDRTLRTAPSVDTALWRQRGNSVPVPERNGGWDFTGPDSGTGTGARHIRETLGLGLLDQGIVFQIKQAGTGTARFRAWLGHSGATTGGSSELPATGWCAQITNAGALSLIKVTATAVETVVGAAIAGKVTTALTWVRMERTAGVVRVRTWLDGATEPSTWDHSVADDTTGVPAGAAGVSHYRTGGTTRTVGKVSVYTPAGGIPVPDMPRLMTRPDGARMPFGRASQIRSDDTHLRPGLADRCHHGGRGQRAADPDRRSGQHRDGDAGRRGR